MHEMAKLEEAKYFLSNMSNTEDQAFRFKLSAFLSAARSVLQYVYNEVEKTQNETWYEKQVSQRPLLRYFKDKRDVNIHRQPVNLNAQIAITGTVALTFSGSVAVTVTDQYGNVIQQNIPAPMAPVPEPKPAADAVMYKYTFADWTGTEDVITLCRSYLAELEAVVNDGIARSYLKQP